MNTLTSPIRSLGISRTALAALLALSLLAKLAADPTEDLIAAAGRGDAPAARAALRAGAQKKGTSSAKALMAAADRGDRVMTDLLLAAGLPVDEVDENSENALMRASFKGREELVAHLLERGAKATYVGRDTYGSEHVALIGALKAGSVKIEKMLLEHGADPNAVNGGVMQMANFSGWPELYQPLKAAGGRDPKHPVMSVPGAEEALAEFKARASKDVAASRGLITFLPTKPTAVQNRARREKCRLAIISDEANVAAADLLTARLSSVKTLELVERAELDRIIAEQKLTRDLGADSGAKLGGLLGADALLLITNRDAAKMRVVETRLVNVHAGLILASFFRPAPLADTNAWAQEMAAQLPALATRAAVHDGIALTLLNVRATLDTSSAREMEKAANLLLANRLLREPGFYLLERSAFDQVVQEIALGKKSADSFWTGSYVVDAIFDPPAAANDVLALTLRFRAGTGPAIEVQVRGPREKLAAVLDEAVSKIHASVTHAPVPAPAAEEATHFVKEAHWQVQVGQYSLARQSMDTAWALGARDFATRRYRLLCHAWALRIPICESRERMVKLLPDARSGYWPSRDYFNQPFRGDDFPTVGAAFEAAFEILRQYEDGCREIEQNDDTRFAEWLDVGRDALQAACFIPILLDTVTMKIEHAEKLVQLRASIQSMFLWVMMAKPPGSASAIAYSELIAEFAHSILVWPADFEQAKEAHRQMMALHFPGKDDFHSRTMLRKTLLNATGICGAQYRDPKSKSAQFINAPFQWWWPMTPAQCNSLSEAYKIAPASDDRLFAWVNASQRLEGDMEAQRVALQMIMSILWEIEPEFERDGRLLGLFAAYYCEPLIYSSPHLSAAKGAAYDNGDHFYFSSEIRAFRRKFFSLMCDRLPSLAGCRYLIEKEKFTPAEAEEVVTALTAHFAGKEGGDAKLRAYCRGLDLPIPEEGFATAKPLPITKFWEPSALRLDSGRRFSISTQTVVWAEDRLWLVGDYFDPWNFETRSSPYVFSVEFPSMKATAIPLPPTLQARTDSRGTIVVTPKRLIVTESKIALLIYDRQMKTWETVPEVRPIGPARILGDDAYVLIEGGILRYDMQRKTVEVVCSQRRNPAQNPMDDPGMRIINIELLPGPELEIRASIGAGKYVHYHYAPLTRAWRKIEPPIPIRPPTEYHLLRNPGFLGWAPIFGADTKGPYFFSSGGYSSSGTGIRLDFSTDKEIEEIWRASNGPPVSIRPIGILATQLGWLILEYNGKYVWFLPLDDLGKYLRENPAAAKIIAEYETKTGAVLVPKSEQSPH